MINKIKFPEYSIFGYKILNSWNSVLSAYLFLLAEFFLTPYFGSEANQYFSGLLFIFLINISILILVLNSLIRFRKADILLIVLAMPLFIYLPFSINKIYLAFHHLKLFIYDL